MIPLNPPLSRRQLLRGATAAGAFALVGAHSSVASAATARFAGDPGIGKLYYGASSAATYGFDTLERQVGGTLGVHRGYFQPSSGGMLQQVKADHAARRLPYITTKVPGTWAEVAAGKKDSWLRPLLTSFAAQTRPVMLTLHHEPEDEAGPTGMKPQDWRSMYDYAVQVAASIAPNVTLVPHLMQWTFAPGSGRNPKDWVPTTTKVFSTGCYNSWSATNGLNWRPLGDKMAMVLPYANGRPIVLAEYGCRTNPRSPGLAAAWMQETFDWCLSHNVVAMSYFNSWQHSKDGSWEVDTERLNAMRKIVKLPSAVTL